MGRNSRSSRRAPPPGNPGPAETKPVPSPARKPSGFSHLLLHLHPRLVPDESLRLSRTFGLGGAALVLFAVLAVSGAMLLVSYEPSPERAWGSVRQLADETPFGAFVRNAHHWGANLLLVVAFLHLLRVFYVGGHLPPRRVNWLVGLGLLALLVASAFTGYLLPWDQLAFWAVTIATGMLEYVPVAGEMLMRAARGGGEIGSRTLSLFFVLHAAILPILMLVLVSFHFWFVRKAGGVVLPRSETGGEPRRTLVPVSPHLVLREGVAALVAVAAVLLLAAVAEAPLLAQANPGMSPNPAKAPWYFMGVQELLVHLHPTFAAVLVPLAAAALLVLLPALAGGESASGRWFESRKGARLALGSALAAAALTPIWVLVDEPIRRARPWFPSVPPAVRGGLLPVLAVAALLAGLYWLARRAWKASRIEATQAAMTFLLVAFVLLTVTGVAFRGQGMALAWPWKAAGAPTGGSVAEVQP